MKFHRFLMLLCLSLIVAACGGGGGDGGSSSFGPTANAGAAQTVAMGETVTLNGSASTVGSAGGTLTYRWTLSSKPTGSNASLSSTTAARPSFVADRPGAYVAELSVNDGTANSAAATVTITATNSEPVAVSVTSQDVLIGSTVTLDGSGSLPPTGGTAAALQYQWTLTAVPPGSIATIRNATTAQAAFYADVAGTYTANLVVTYAGRISDALPVTVTAKASNAVPVAVAEVSLIGGVAATPTNTSSPFRYTLERGKTVTFSAAKSTDADGNALSYRWYFFSPSASAALTGAQIPTASQLSRATVLTGVNPTFTPDVAGNWTAYLYVFDGTSVSSVSATTSVSLAVTKPATNTPPVALFLTEGDSFEVEIGTTAYRSGNSYDIDADTLTRRYQWISTPAGFAQPDLSTATSLAFTPNVAGDYTVQMIVNDGTVDSAPVRATFVARTGANVRPVAGVTVDTATVMVGDTAWFDASTSSDFNRDALTYEWTLIDRPDGSTAALRGSTSVRTSLVADKAGVYIARLKVTDGLGATSQSTYVSYGKVQAKTSNNAPTVNGLFGRYTAMFISFWAEATTSTSTLGTDAQPLVAGHPFTLGARSIVDPDNDTLYYLWTLGQPTGSTLADAGTASGFSFTPAVAGTYTGTLVTSDGVAASPAQSVSVKVVDEANYPTLLMKTFGLSSNLSTVAPVVWPYSLTDTTYARTGAATYYSLTAYGGDYTITNLSTTSAVAGVAAGTFTGLTNGKVIRRGETVTFSIESAYAAQDQAVDFTWSFGIQEKPDYTFLYRRVAR